MQIKLLKILARLGAGDKGASDNMYAVLGDALRKANTGHTISNAIVAECVRTITAIYPNPALLQAGAPCACADMNEPETCRCAGVPVEYQAPMLPQKSCEAHLHLQLSHLVYGMTLDCLCSSG